MLCVKCSINKPDHVRHDYIWFYAVGIGKENSQDPLYSWPLKKFSTLVSMCKDDSVSADYYLITYITIDAKCC